MFLWTTFCPCFDCYGTGKIPSTTHPLTNECFGEFLINWNKCEKQAPLYTKIRDPFLANFHRSGVPPKKCGSWTSGSGSPTWVLTNFWAIRQSSAGLSIYFLYLFTNLISYSILYLFLHNIILTFLLNINLMMFFSLIINEIM